MKPAAPLLRTLAVAAMLLAACLVHADALAQAGGAAATAAASPRSAGEPRATAVLRDREFGVRTHAIGLQRRVEMYQWRLGDDGRYRALWWPRPIDSSGYSDRFRNPGAFPLETRYWIGEGITVGGRPVDDAVIKRLGAWRSFRPGFTALPGNLAATFQPEGDGLSSSENPLDPRVGDLRVTWREMVLPPIDGRVALRDGRWVIAHGQQARAVAVRAGAAPVAAATAQGVHAGGIDGRAWWIAGAAMLALLVAVVMVRRRR